MHTLLLAIGLMLASVAGLAAGVFFGRPPVKGSCGGLASPHAGGCEACGRGDGCGR